MSQPPTHPPASERPQTGHDILAWLGWKSIRGRYFYGASLFALLLAGAAAYTTVRLLPWKDSDLLERNSLQQSLRSMSDDLRRSEIALQEYLALMAPAQSNEAKARLGYAANELARLSQNDWVIHNENARAAALDLTQLLETLDREFDNLIKSRVSRTQALQLLQENIRNQFEQTRTSLDSLESVVNAYSIADIVALSDTANQLSRAIWLLVGFGALATALGYLFLEFSIRRPLSQVVGALKAEADGVSTVRLTHGSTQETQDVVDAFAHMRQQVHSRQQRLEIVLDNAAEGIMTFDENGTIEQFNQAAERLFGHTEVEIVNQNIGNLIMAPHGHNRKDYASHFIRTKIQRLIGQEGEVTGRHKDGSTFAMALKISRISLDGRDMYIGLVADISERKAMVERLKNMAEHDGLTALYNRTYFQQELERVVERARRTSSPTSAVLYIDLDNFKYVNDTLGHAAGDQLLIEVASILHKRARKSDLISRFGGDEFTVLLYDITPELAQLAAESFRKKLANYSFRHAGEHVNVGCSIGVASIDTTANSAEDVLAHADLACHLAKRNGRNQVHVYMPSDAENATTMSLDMGWSRRIKNAVENDGFVLACQPIVNSRSSEVDGYEVLIRMLDENGSLIMPSGFFPSADRFGLSTEIDKWVIKNSIETLKQRRQQIPTLKYSINLSGQTLSNLTVCDLIQQKLWETGLDPSALTFEVTETVAITNLTAAQAFLARLREMGCRAALDDFGSGMSSFAYLRDLPVDYVKIDGRFVRNVMTNPIDLAILRAINDVVHAFGKQTVAEFVENEATFRLLQEYGVDYAQGYYLGRPEVGAPTESKTPQPSQESYGPGATKTTAKKAGKS